MTDIRSVDGTTIGCESIGSGPALVLVDGAMCYRAAGPLSALASSLQEHFTVHTYDRRGRGESSDTAPYAVAREVEDVQAVIAQAGGSAAEALPTAEFRVLDGQTHDVAPDALAPVLISFFGG